MTLLTLFALGDDTQTTQTVYDTVRDDVARLIRARARGRGGQPGVFTATSNPTADEVDLLIDDAAADIAAVVGEDLPVIVQPLARRVIALGTALLIEQGSDDFNPERYDRLDRMYQRRLKDLAAAAQDAEAGDDPGQVDDRPGPVAAFPAATPLDW